MMDFWSSFLTIGLGSGSSFAAANLAFSWFKEKRSRADALRYLALQLALHFESFALDCATRVGSNYDFDEHDGHVGAAIRCVPQPGPLPSNEAFRFLAPEILDDVLSFSQLCQMAQDNAYFWMEYLHDHECYRNAAADNSVCMGYEALGIARRIRQIYRLRVRVVGFKKWDINEFLSSEYHEIEIRERKIEDANAASA